MKYEVKQDLMNGIVNYLVSKPYAEVFQLLEAVRQLKPIAEPGDQVAPQAAPEVAPDANAPTNA